jgi:LCP family protein required for cell wall assembly
MASPTPPWLPPERRPARWPRIALVVTVVLVLIAGGGIVTGIVWLSRVNDHLKRTASLDGMAGPQRPAEVSGAATNILLLGSDSRDPDQPSQTGGNWRTDTIVLMHVPASHDRAQLVSLPRDLWVDIPGQGTMAKINAATALGGVGLMLRTVEAYTGIRIDHLVLIDFAGFERVTDALGGVDLNIERTITSIHKPHRTFTKGVHHLTGAEALDYIRQREQFPDGDFARMRHQQEFLKAIMDRATADPTRLPSFISAVADAITVDKGFSLTDTVWQLHGLRGGNLTFVTCPNAGPGDVGDQSVVLPDQQKAASLFAAIKADTVDDWLRANPTQ